MKGYAWILLQKLAHELGLVGGEIVENDVDLPGGVGNRATTSFRKVMKSLGWCGVRRSFHGRGPVAVSSAAYKERVPCR